jgi:cysteine-S-conjugate beta-lyase
MIYNFDKIIQRENTACVKYDLRKEFFGNATILPLWVADMDFETPDFIREAVIKRASHPVYGYTFRTDSFSQSIIDWMLKRHHWEIKKNWVSFSPGVVPALNMAVLAFTKPGDKVIVQPPVYFPFFTAVKNHGRELVYNQLIEKDGRYEMDFEDLEKKADENTRLLLLCHPHNPVGRLWSKKELQTLIDICDRKNILIISDEIHSDLMLNGNVHIPLATISQKAADICLTCIAPSKTFNLAGLSTSALIIPNENHKKEYEKVLDHLHIGMGNLFGITSLESAYNHGGEWLDQLLQYLNQNFRLLNEFFVSRIPGVKVIQAEATYLIWLDFRELGLNNKELKEFIIEKAGIGLNDGPSFGPGGDGFQRINIALPRQCLIEAMERLEKAVNALKT